MITVHGQVRRGPVMSRRVTMTEFVLAWGPWAWRVWRATARSPLVIGDRRVWIER